MKKIKFLFALAASSFALSSFAQTDWPNKPIQIIVTFAPGGTSDVLARAIAPDLSKALGQPVPISAHDAFERLHLQGCITQHELDAWRAIVGLRNRIVHDYLNVDPDFVNGLVLQNKHHFIADFLRQKISS